MNKEQYERIKEYFKQGESEMINYIEVIEDGADKDSWHYDELLEFIGTYDELVVCDVFRVVINGLEQTFENGENVFSFREYCTKKYFAHLDKINKLLETVHFSISKDRYDYDYMLGFYKELDEKCNKLVHQFKLTWSTIWNNILNGDLTRDLFEIE